MSVAPSVSAEESFLIIAFRFASSRAPKASDTVTTAGRPSGTADTARATAVSKASIIVSIPPDLRKNRSYSSRIKMRAVTATIIIPSFLANFVSFLFRGVSTCSTDLLHQD